MLTNEEIGKKINEFMDWIDANEKDLLESDHIIHFVHIDESADDGYADYTERSIATDEDAYEIAMSALTDAYLDLSELIPLTPKEFLKTVKNDLYKRLAEHTKNEKSKTERK